jgi:hypothetical protein
MSSVSPMALTAEQSAAACASCGAALVADQRYCLTCGEPCSPVRLSFLDVLQSDTSPSAPTPWAGGAAIELGPVGYVPLEPGASGWLRRYSGLLGLLSLLVLCLLVGLLVGHWVTQGTTKVPGTQIVKVEGLGNLTSAAAGASAAPASTTPTASAPAASSKASEKEEAEESKEAAKETKAEKAPPAKPVKVAPAKLRKLSSTTGKQHQEEVNALGAQPIETGG